MKRLWSWVGQDWCLALALLASAWLRLWVAMLDNGQPSAEWTDADRETAMVKYVETATADSNRKSPNCADLGITNPCSADELKNGISLPVLRAKEDQH